MRQVGQEPHRPPPADQSSRSLVAWHAGVVDHDRHIGVCGGHRGGVCELFGQGLEVERQAVVRQARVAGAPGRIRQVVRALALVGVQDLADAADIGVLRVRLEHLVQAWVLQGSVGDDAVRKAALVGDGLQPGGLRE